MSKPIYKPQPMYKSNINDMIEDLEKGGPGSGKRGHKTTLDGLVSDNTKKKFREAASKIDKQQVQHYVDKYRMKHPEGMLPRDMREWLEGANLSADEVNEAVKRLTPKTPIGANRSKANVRKY